MRTAWLLPLFFLSVPACSEDDGDGDDAGRAGSNADDTMGGRGGVAGTAGRGGSGGAAGSAGSASAGSSGAAGSAGSASAGSSGAAGSGASGGAAGASGSSASGVMDCDGLCSSRPVCPSAECLSSCEDTAELCPDELEALLECGEPLSDDDFQCVGGVPVPGDELCVTESAALARCRIGF